MLHLKAQPPAAPTTSMGVEEDMSLTPFPREGGGQLLMPCAETSWIKGLQFSRVNILLSVSGTDTTYFLCSSEDLQCPVAQHKVPGAAHCCVHTPAAVSSHEHHPAFLPQC